MASEETKILEIKVEYQEAIKKIGEYKTKIDEIKDAEARYKKEVKEGTITQQEYNERITAAKVKTNEYKTAIKVLEKQVTSQIKTQKSNADIMEEVNGLLGVNAKSIAEAQAANKALREAVRNLSDEEEGAYEMRQKLNAQIDENTRYIQRNSDEYVKQKMTIGDYKEQVKLAMVELKNGGLSMNSVGIIAKGFAENLSRGVAGGLADVASGTRTLIGLFNLLKVAIIATGIGALLIALTSLAAAFSSSQKGLEFFQVTMAKTGAVVDVLVDRLALVGEALIDLINLDFSNFGDKIKNAFAGMGEEMKNEWQLAGDLKESLIDIEKAETMLGMKRAANRAEIEKLKMVSEDVTKSTKERQEAAKKAFDMERELMTEEISLQERRIANQLGFTEVTDEVRQSMKDIATGAISADEAISKLGISSSTIDDLKTFSEDVKELYDKTESSTTRQIELQNKLNSISNEGKEKQLALTDKEIAAVREMEDALLGVIQNEKEKERKALEMSYDREIEDLKKRLQTEKDLTEKAKDAILATIKAKEQAKVEALNSQDIANEIANQQKLIQLQLDGVKEGTRQEHELRMQQLQSQREAELQDKTLTEQMKLAIVQKYEKMMSDETARYATETSQKQMDAIKVRFETAMEQAYGNEKEILRIQMEQRKAELDAIQQMEGESLEEFNLRRLQAENDFLDAKKDLRDKEVEIEQSKLQAMSDITGGLISLMEAIGEENKAMAVASKVLALAEIAINTGKAIAAGVAEAVKIGFPQNIAAIATTVATVLANIATAIKTVKSAKFATGGDVTGPGTGTSDSIHAMLSNGESVLTAKATSMFAPILSAMNQAGGGVPINGQKTGNQAMGEDMLARAFAKGVAGLPNPVVSVVDINNTAKRVEVIENINVI